VEVTSFVAGVNVDCQRFCPRLDLTTLAKGAWHEKEKKKLSFREKGKILEN